MNPRLAIETATLTRVFGSRTAVAELQLRVPQGSIYGFLGPNGAGKTTTIRLLVGLLVPNRGEIAIFGERLTRATRDRIAEKVGALVDAPSLYPHLTGEENLQHAQRLRNLPAEVVDRAIERFGLASDMRRRVSEYSLGMRQRLGLAIAFLGDPPLVILDEPANGLDPVGTIELRDLLRKIRTENGTTILVSSHVLSEVERIADEIGIIHQGRLVYQGRLSDLRGPKEVIFRVEATREAAAALAAAKWKIAEMGERFLVVPVQSEEDIAAVNRELVLTGFDVLGIESRETTLEEMFLSLVGKKIAA